jgi:hypothetical protein
MEGWIDGEMVVRGSRRRCARVIGQSNTRHTTQRFCCAGRNTHASSRPPTPPCSPPAPCSPRHALRGKSCANSRFPRSADVICALVDVLLMPAPPSPIDLAPKLLRPHHLQRIHLLIPVLLPANIPPDQPTFRWPNKVPHQQQEGGVSSSP